MGADHDDATDANTIIQDFHRRQLEHIQNMDPRCRALQLPEGILLRYMLAKSLYFYLRSGVKDGKITTQIFASDSPYERQKTHIGDINTPMFEQRADLRHVERLQRLLNAWVGFVKEVAESDQEFKSFSIGE